MVLLCPRKHALENLEGAASALCGRQGHRESMCADLTDNAVAL
jgi:hypothetical protein